MLTRLMALRVLLADESATIRKVFQLALQDYAVEVTAVTVGLDVLQVAKKIKPDIVFADVILQRKSGYDVCRDIKNDPSLSQTPVVLIWSGFMELDEEKYNASGANASLEKPFDAQKLRGLVQNLVPKTQTQTLAPYLNFPKLPDFEEETPVAVPRPPRISPMDNETALPPASAPSPGGSWSMESFAPLQPPPLDDEPPEDFLAVDLPSEPPPPPKRASLHLASESDEDEAQWVQKPLSSYKLPPEKQSPAKPSVKYTIPGENADSESVITNKWTRPQAEPSLTTENPDVYELDLSASPGDTETPASPQIENKNRAELEDLVRARATEVIEKVVWEVVPEIATRIIERELARLLKERNKS